jgi:putative ABC transport system permease protein
MYHAFFFPLPLARLSADKSALGLALTVAAAAATLGVLNAVRKAAKLPPAEAMRPEPPANYRPAFVNAQGSRTFFSNTFRIAVRKPRNANRFKSSLRWLGWRWLQAFSSFRTAFATASVQILEFQWDTCSARTLGRWLGRTR